MKVSFKVKSDLKALDQVLSDFEQINQPWIPRKDWLQCQLALAEGFTNAVRHAHKGLSSNILIDIEITLTQQEIEIRIWDSGKPFDLEGFIEKNLTQDNRWSGHGQGLRILQQIADRLSYIRTEQNRNCLIITKQFLVSEVQKNYE
ncbi:ATP-binding protein [Gloeothece verrucosa]|uniref:Putative anti-sigma regulatory factor, serine/threonine protein kinase n=1 Tax=Gloeothece verrucosa (strain PCC 7822) TaxID=497965 RepID=E0UFB2_GLOV7|nr:ATP-binding protein [Gloeothece verrucosa]ADN15483.1 putative anti-sigma regulatory factor, serine/threonine protein kinase [Gloeothece verrucosa PCC 7822]